jgi:hypothetical protein
VAVARSILVIIWVLLPDTEAQFVDLGADYYTTRPIPERRVRHPIRELQALATPSRSTRPPVSSQQGFLDQAAVPAALYEPTGYVNAPRQERQGAVERRPDPPRERHAQRPESPCGAGTREGPDSAVLTTSLTTIELRWGHSRSAIVS